MRLTGPKRFAPALLLTAALVLGAAEDSPHAALARVASALSQNEPQEALAVFDKSGADFGAIEAAIGALTAQAEILCAIEIVEEKTTGSDKVLDTDWFLQLKPSGQGGEATRRRERVSITMRLVRGKWRIVTMKPLSILGPIVLNR